MYLLCHLPHFSKVPLFLPHPRLQLTTGGFFAVTWAHVSHARVSFPFPLSAQLCQPLRPLLAPKWPSDSSIKTLFHFVNVFKTYLTQNPFFLQNAYDSFSVPISGTAIPEIQVRGREETPSWAPTLCSVPCMAWRHRTQLLKSPASRYFQVAYWLDTWKL